ncbi:hypothetical protein ACWIEX_05970 [Bosea sp. NPDC055353]
MSRTKLIAMGAVMTAGMIATGAQAAADHVKAQVAKHRAAGHIGECKESFNLIACVGSGGEVRVYMDAKAQLAGDAAMKARQAARSCLIVLPQNEGRHIIVDDVLRCL